MKVYIDAGHGGKDNGASGNGIKEKDITLKIALEMRDYLLANYNGVSVKMSRTKDTYPTLTERTNEANAWGADVFISIHVNAGGGTGFETFVYNGVGGKTKDLQNRIHTELMRDTYFDFADRGQKEANLHVCRESKMPAVLTENLFIDTKKDADFLKQNKQLHDAGANHAQAVAKFGGLKRKEKKESKPSKDTFYRVVTGSFNDKDNADDRVKELKKKGFDSFIDVYKK